MIQKPISKLLLALLIIAGLAVTGCGKSETTEVPAKPAKSAATKSAAPAAATAASKMPVPFDIAIQAALNGHAATVMQALETGTDPN